MLGLYIIGGTVAVLWIIGTLAIEQGGGPKL